MGGISVLIGMGLLIAIVTGKIYKKYYKYDVLFTILSIVSLGILRPVLLFAIRNNKKITI